MKKCGNTKQLIYAYDIQFTSGIEAGKRAIIAANGKTEICVGVDNGLDILWARYCGTNLSFLSKNGLNNRIGTFANRFDGGMLYTCGLDNVSGCVEGAPIHGSHHLTPAENVNIQYSPETVTISGIIRYTMLFGISLELRRSITVTSCGFEIKDSVVNTGYVNGRYCLLYHINFGYPMLDGDAKIRLNCEKSEGLTEKAQNNIAEAFNITEPEDYNPEEVYYHSLKEGWAELVNPNLPFKARIDFSLDTLPVFVEWKSMQSGDYALGLEPASTRFDTFKQKEIKPGEQVDYKVCITLIDDKK